MNLLKKTLFVSSLMMVLLSLFACTRKEANNDPQNANDSISAIAEFDLPAGYSSEFSTSMLGYTVEAYKGQNGPSHLYLIQSEKESDGEELAKMLTQLVPGARNPDTGLSVIENSTMTVRGQEATVIVSQGVNSENVEYRQVSVAFDGKGGPALLVFSESLDAWNQAIFDEFLASIH